MNSDSSKPPDEVVQFLWLCKLKSRSCFLLIAEFTTPKLKDYSMPVLKMFLRFLNPNGSKFYSHYVLN